MGTRRSKIWAKIYVNRLPFRWNFSNCQVSLFNDSSSLFNSEIIWELSDLPSRSSLSFSATFSNNSISWFFSNFMTFYHMQIFFMHPFEMHSLVSISWKCVLSVSEDESFFSASILKLLNRPTRKWSFEIWFLVFADSRQ